MCAETSTKAPAPNWSDFAAASLRAIEAHGVPRHLDVVSAIDDALQWVSDARPYVKRLHQSAWRSSFDDACTALQFVGLSLGAQIEPARLTCIGHLAGLLATGPSPTARQHAATALNEVQSLLRSPAALSAAWDDFLGVCRAPTRTNDDVRALAAIFLCIAELQGRNKARTAHLLSGILVDSAWEIMDARGTLEASLRTGTQPGDLAGASEEERRRAAEQVLSTPPRAHHHVVWVAFHRASVRQHPCVTVGSVSFYDAPLVHEITGETATAAFPIPSELKTLDQRSIPDTPNTVLARVDLGSTIEADPPARAALLAETVVAAAALTSTQGEDRTWLPMSGFLHAVDGGVVSWQSFSPREPFSPSPWAYEIIGTELQSLHGTLLDHGQMTPALLSQLGAVRWFLDASVVAPASRLLLDVSVLEFRAASAQPGTDSWWAYLTQDWKDVWIRDRVRLEIANVLRQAVYEPISGESDADPPPHLQRAALLDQVIAKEAESQWNVNMQGAVSCLPALARLFSPYTSLGRQLATLAERTSSVAELRSWVGRLDEEWDTLCARAQRCRNALAHGGPSNDRVVASASSFVHLLTTFVLWEQLRPMLEPPGTESRGEDIAGRARRWREHMSMATDAGSAVCGPEAAQ